MWIEYDLINHSNTKTNHSATTDEHRDVWGNIADGNPIKVDEATQEHDWLTAKLPHHRWCKERWYQSCNVEGRCEQLQHLVVKFTVATGGIALILYLMIRWRKHLLKERIHRCNSAWKTHPTWWLATWLQVLFYKFATVNPLNKASINFSSCSILLECLLNSQHASRLEI